MLHVEGNTITFWLRVKPRSAREGLGLDSAGHLFLGLHAAPTEGQANDACVRFLARVLRLPQSSVAIVTGHKSRRKLLRISAHAAAETAARLAALVHSQREAG